MENIDAVIDDYGNESDFILTPNAINFLKETSKWAKFIAILGFIGLGLMVLGGLSVMLMGANFGRGLGGMQMNTGIIGFVYLIMSVLYFFPMYYLYNFSVKIKDGLALQNKDVLESAFGFLKSHYKFIGILIIVMIAMYVLTILFTIFAGVSGVFR